MDGHQWLTEYNQSKQHYINQTASEQETPYIPYLLDAIYAVAHGLHHVLGCTPKRGCKLTPAEFSKINRYFFLFEITTTVGSTTPFRKTVRY